MWDLGTIIAMNQEAQDAADAARLRRRQELLDEIARMDNEGACQAAYERSETIDFPAAKAA